MINGQYIRKQLSVLVILFPSPTLDSKYRTDLPHFVIKTSVQEQSATFTGTQTIQLLIKYTYLY